MLTTVQLQIVKADILADPVLNAFPNNSDGAFEIAAIYNQVVSPDFWVWRTRITQAEIVGNVSVDGTSWSWPQFISRTIQEQAGWREMFADGFVNAALPNVRQGFADIFSGAQAGPTAQRAHLLAVGRRKGSRIEKLLGSGTGTTASPATMGFEGPISYQDVLMGRNS